MTTTPTVSWEAEYEKKYVVKSNAGTGLLRYTDADELKAFIRTKKAEWEAAARQEAHKALVDFIYKHRTADNGETVFVRFKKSSLEEARHADLNK